jgi:signal peptidase I
MTTDAKGPADAKASDGKGGAAHEAVELIKTVVYALLIALVLRVVLFQPYTIPSASDEPNLYQGDYIIASKWSYGWSKNSIPFSPPLFSGRLLFNAPQRGDIIIFKLPRDAATTHTDYIKRLIGLPGDKVQVKAGVVYVNGAPLPRMQLPDGRGDLPEGNGPVRRFMEKTPEGRSFVIQQAPGEGPADNTGVYVVPPHCYFMMGDNRDNSLDSRFDPAMPIDQPGLPACGWDSSVDQYLPQDEAGVGFVPEEDLVGKAQIVLVSWKPGAELFKPWTWLSLRPERFFHPVH